MSEFALRMQPILPAVQEAGTIIRQNFRGNLHIESKSTAFDLVTQVDRAVEELLVKTLAGIYPEIPVLGEESHDTTGIAFRPDRLMWVLDPLDGTANFAMGIPFFCISLALCQGNEPLLALVYNPLDRDCFLAEKGRGARLNGEPIRVSSAPLEEGMLSMRLKRSDTVVGNDLTPHLPRAGGMRSFGAAALELAYVACGRLVGYQEQHLHFWDVAAGVLLVEEAGGRIDLVQQGGGHPGSSLPIDGWFVQAVNPTVHAQVTSEA